jgi:hypothetical protein
LPVKQALGFFAEEGEEIIVIGSKNEKKEGHAKGKAQDQERRRDEGDLEIASKDELEDEKKDHGYDGNSQPVSNEKKKSQMSEEKSLDIQVDVEVVNEKNKKGAKKKPCDEGVQEDLQKLHSRKNYHDSHQGSSRPNPLQFPGLFTSQTDPP